MNRALPDLTRALETLNSIGATVPSPLKQPCSDSKKDGITNKCILGIRNPKVNIPIHDRFALPSDSSKSGSKTNWSLNHQFVDRPVIPQLTFTEKQKRSILRHQNNFLKKLEEDEREEDERNAKQEELRRFKTDISDAAAKMNETIRAMDEITVQGIQEGRYHSDDEFDDGTASRTSISTTTSGASRNSNRMKHNQSASSMASLPSIAGRNTDALKAVKELEEFKDDGENVDGCNISANYRHKKSNFKEYLEDQLLRAGSALPIEYYSRQLNHRKVHKEIVDINDRIELSTRQLRKTMIDLGIEDREKREKDREADKVRAKAIVEEKISKEIQILLEQKGINAQPNDIMSPEERALEEQNILSELKAKRKREAAAALDVTDDYDSDDMAELNQELQRIGEVFKADAIDDCRLPEPILDKLHWLKNRTLNQMKSAIKMEKSIIRDEVKDMQSVVHEREKILLQYKDQLDEIENVFKEQAHNEKLVKDVIETKFKATLTQLNDHLLKQNQKVLEISESIASSQKYRFKIMSMIEEISKKRLRCDPFVRRRAMNLVKGLLKNLDDAALIAQEERENRLREQYRLMLEMQQRIQLEEETIGAIQDRNREIDKEIKSTSDRIAKEKMEYKERAQALKAKDELTSSKLQNLESVMSEYAREERRKVHSDNKSKRLTKRQNNGDDGDRQPMSDAHFVKHLQEKFSSKEKDKKSSNQDGSAEGVGSSSAEEDDNSDNEDDDDDDNHNGSDGSSDDDVIKNIRADNPDVIPPIKKALDTNGNIIQGDDHQFVPSLRDEALGGRPPLLDEQTESALEISVNEGARKNMIEHKVSKVDILKPETTIATEGAVMVLPGAYDPISSTRAKRQTFLATTASTSTAPGVGQFTPLELQDEDDEDDSEDEGKASVEAKESLSSNFPKDRVSKSMGIVSAKTTSNTVGSMGEANVDPTSLYHPVVSSICTACYAHYYQEYLMKHPAMNFQRNSPRATMAVSSMNLAPRRNSNLSVAGRNHPNVNPLIDCVNQNTFQFTIEESAKVLLECLDRLITRKETTASAHVGGSGLKGGTIISEAMGNEMKQEINALVKLSLIHQIALPSQSQKGKSKENTGSKGRRANSIVNSSSSVDTPKLYPDEYLELLFKFHGFCKLVLQTIAKNSPKLLLINNTRTMFAKVLQDILAIVGVVSNVTLYFWDPVVIATRLNISSAGSFGRVQGINLPQTSINYALLYVKTTGWLDVFGRQVIDAILHYGQGDNISPGHTRTKQQEIRRMSRLLATMKDKNTNNIKFDDEVNQDNELHPYADPDLLFQSLFDLIQQYFVPDHFQTFHKEKAIEIQSLVSFFLSECKQMINDGADELYPGQSLVDREDDDGKHTKSFERSHRNALQCMESFLLIVFHVNDAVIKKSMKKQSGSSFGGTYTSSDSNLKILLNMMTFYIERARHDGDNLGKVKSGYVVETPLVSLENIDDLLMQLAYPQIAPAIIAINLLRRVVEEELSKRQFLQKIILGRPEVADLQYLNIAMTENEERMMMSLTRQQSDESSNEVTSTEIEDSTKTQNSSGNKVMNGAGQVTSVQVLSVPSAPQDLSPTNRPDAGLLAATTGKVATTKDSLTFSGRKTVLVQTKEFSLPLSMLDEKGAVNVRPHPPNRGDRDRRKLSTFATTNSSLSSSDKTIEVKNSTVIEENDKNKEVQRGGDEVPTNPIFASPKSAGSRIRKMIALTTTNVDDIDLIEMQIGRAEEMLRKFQDEEGNERILEPQSSTSDDGENRNGETGTEENINSTEQSEKNTQNRIVVKRFKTTRDVHQQWLNDLEVYIHHLCRQISAVIWSGGGNMPTETILSSATNTKSRFKRKAAIPLPETLIFRILNYVDALRRLILSRNVNTKEILLGAEGMNSMVSGKLFLGKSNNISSSSKGSEMFKEFQSIVSDIRRYQHRILHIINVMTTPLRRRLHWLQKKYDEFIEEHFSLLTNIEDMKKKFDQTKSDIEEYRKSIGLIQQEKTQKVLTNRLKNSVNALRGQPVDDRLAVGVSGANLSPTKISRGNTSNSTGSAAGTPKGKVKKGSIASVGSGNIPGQQVQTINLVPHSFQIQKLILEHASNEYLSKLNSLRQKETMLVMALKHFQQDYETLANHSRGLALAHQDMLTSLPPTANRQEIKSVLSSLSFDSEELLKMHLNGRDSDEEEDDDRFGKSMEAIDENMRRHQATLNRTTLMLDAYTRDSIASRFLNQFGAKNGAVGMAGGGGNVGGGSVGGGAAVGEKKAGIPPSLAASLARLGANDPSFLTKHPRLSDILPQYLAQAAAAAAGKISSHMELPKKLTGKEWIDIYLKEMGGDGSLHGHGMLPISPKKNPFHQSYFTNSGDANQPGFMKMTVKLEKTIKNARLKWYQDHYDKDGNYIGSDGDGGFGNYDYDGIKRVLKQVVKPKVFGFARTIRSGLVDMEKLSEEQRYNNDSQEMPSNKSLEEDDKKEDTMARSFLFYLGGNIFNPSTTFVDDERRNSAEANSNNPDGEEKALVRPHSTGALDRRKSFSKEFQPFLTLEGREIKPLSFDSAPQGSKKRFYLERLNRVTPFKYSDVFNSDNFRIFTPLNLRKLLDVQEMILKNDIKTFNDLHVRDGENEETSDDVNGAVTEGKRLPGSKLSMNVTADVKRPIHSNHKKEISDLGMSIQGVSMQVPESHHDVVEHGRMSIGASLAASHHDPNHPHFGKKQLKAMLRQARHTGVSDGSESRATRVGQGFPQILMAMPGQVSSRNTHIHGRRSLNPQSLDSNVPSSSLAMTDSISSLTSTIPVHNKTIVQSAIAEGEHEEDDSQDNVSHNPTGKAGEKELNLKSAVTEIDENALLEDSTAYAELRQFEFSLDKDIQKMIKRMRAERKKQLKALKKKQEMSITQSALYNLAKTRSSGDPTVDERKSRGRNVENRSRSNSRSPSPEHLRNGLQSRGGSTSDGPSVNRNLDIEYEEWQIKILQWLANTSQDNAKIEIETRGGINHEFDNRPVEIGVGLHHHGSIFNALDFEHEKKPIYQWKDIGAFNDEYTVAFGEIDQMFQREVGSLGEPEGNTLLGGAAISDFFSKHVTLSSESNVVPVPSNNIENPREGRSSILFNPSPPGHSNAVLAPISLVDGVHEEIMLSSMGTYEQLKHKKRVRITEIHNKNYDQQYKRNHAAQQTLESFSDEIGDEEPTEAFNFSPSLVSSNPSRGESRNTRYLSTAEVPPGTASRPGSVTSGILNETTLASMLSHKYHVNNNPMADIPTSQMKPPAEPKSSAAFASPRKSKIK